MSVVTLSDSATIVLSKQTTSGSVQTFSLGNSTIQNRLIYIKEAAISPAPTNFDLTGYINDITSVNVNDGAAMTLHLSTNIWHVLAGISPNQFTSLNAPTSSTPIYPSMDVSRYFVDLRTESKTVVLPSIQSISPIITTASPIFTFKDVYGNASNNPLFISTSGNAMLENPSVSYATKLDSNYASIDIFANRVNNRWHFINYYAGDAVTEASPFTNTDTPSSIYMSTSLAYVSRFTNEAAEVNKVIMLPKAEDVVGQMFYVTNIGEIIANSFSLLSTQHDDFMDDTLSSIYLLNQWESVQVVAHSSTRYSVTTDWKLGTAPF